MFSHKNNMIQCSATTSARVEAATWRWVDDVVIKMGLCPFAAPVRKFRDLKSGQPALRVAVSNAGNTTHLLRDVRREFELLRPGLATFTKHACEEEGASGRSESATLYADAERTSVPHSTLLVVSPQPAQDAGRGGRLHTDTKSFLGDFREFVHVSWDVQEALVASGLQDALQVVLFHPQAVHSLYGEQMPHAARSDEEGEACSYDSEAANYSVRAPYPTFHFLREGDILAAISSGYPQPEKIPERNARKLAAIGSDRLRSQWQGMFGS